MPIVLTPRFDAESIIKANQLTTSPGISGGSSNGGSFQPIDEEQRFLLLRAHSSSPSMGATSSDHRYMPAISNSSETPMVAGGFTRQFRSSISSRLRFMSRPGHERPKVSICAKFILLKVMLMDIC